MMSLACLLLLLWQWASKVSTEVLPRAAGDIPDYVLDYAPLTYLDVDEIYFPSDLQAQLDNTQPRVNLTLISDVPTPLTLSNLALLNSYGDNGTDVYLTSTVDITTDPAYLYGVAPDSDGETENATSAVIVVYDHGDGYVDGFYFYFYAYNQGNKFLGVELGDHVGDWEHNMIRFYNGVPQAIWYSQHGNGEAFTYSCAQKIGVRPVNYSARGTHANYAINGTHDHTIPDHNLPEGLLVDYTSNGDIWDPLLNAFFYTYDANTTTFTASTTYGVDDNPTSFMYFLGKWGDEQYPDSDPRQLNFLGLDIEYRYVSGPTGPIDKQLNRTNVCPDDGVPCILRTKLGP